MTTLSIPQRRDPMARLSLFALIGAVVCVAVISAGSPAPTAAQSDIILVATPAATPALPTPAQNDPALALAAPTPEPQGWLDQALGTVGAAADQMASQQAALFDQEHAAALAAAEQAAAQAAAEQAARDQYLANVGAQNAHSPRGDVPAPPAFTPGWVALPAENGEQVVIDPRPMPPIDQMAAAVPAISQEQAAVIGARDSNGCAPGDVFYPRTGCHTPGSGGPQPGAVGEP